MTSNPTRVMIAQLAAQLVCEHGIRDFSLAKRKAARQLSIVDAHHLPSNGEIETAVRDYQMLFHGDSYPQFLRQLRGSALATMQMLAQFDPYLTGPVLTGSISRYADVHIELFTDSEKDVEMYLLNHTIQFRQSQRPGESGHRAMPCFILEGEDCDTRITVQSPDSGRNAARSGQGEPLRRASLAQLIALLKQSDGE